VGAYGKDNVNFLGTQRSPRFYTELFMESASAPPPPPPSGGGGGGGSPQPPPSGGGGGGTAASPARHDPKAKALQVDAPAAPRASSPLDGGTLVEDMDLTVQIHRKRLGRIRYAVDAVEDGFEVLVLSDRAIDSDHAPIPSLLATAAVHHHLIRKGYRGQVGIIVEAGDVWEVHHFACLIGFGATANERALPGRDGHLGDASGRGRAVPAQVQH